MSTNTILPVVNTVKKDVSYLTHHLILTGVIASLLALGTWGIQSLVRAAHREAAQQSAQELQLVVQQVKALQDKQTADDAAAAQREAARDALLKDLIAQAAARDAALEAQIKKNETLTAQQAAARISDQYKANIGEVTAQGNNVLVDLPISRDIVTTFDSFQVCKADLSDANKQIDTQKGSIVDLKTQVSDRDKTIAGKDTELDKQKKADADDKRVAVDNEKKKHKWYAVAAIVLVEGIRIYFTHKP